MDVELVRWTEVFKFVRNGFSNFASAAVERVGLEDVAIFKSL